MEKFLSLGWLKCGQVPAWDLWGAGSSTQLGHVDELHAKGCRDGAAVNVRVVDQELRVYCFILVVLESYAHASLSISSPCGWIIIAFFRNWRKMGNGMNQPEPLDSVPQKYTFGVSILSAVIHGFRDSIIVLDRLCCYSQRQMLHTVVVMSFPKHSWWHSSVAYSYSSFWL